MKLAKLVILFAVTVLLTGGTALAEDPNDSMVITFKKVDGSVQVEVTGNDPSAESAVPVKSDITGDVKKKMEAEGLSHLKDVGTILISNPCAWVRIGGKWYWRCW